MTTTEVLDEIFGSFELAAGQLTRRRLAKGILKSSGETKLREPARSCRYGSLSGGSGRVTGGKGVMCSDSHGVRRKVQVEVAGIIPAVGTGPAVEPWPVKFAIGA